ncbi:MAG: hypothetical protein AN488_00750 [Anabaena sp. WA113]|jgi:hypothetical protein|uniref:PBS lyase n=1 Tax=Aphanizomenon flos-aquae WA102 TaxID=1710896 RepID=A0A1B7WQ19_APHFL|nr:hypothetical protein [Nostocales cyanobacterium W4_Combined_metabat2_030]OBQ24708.1 MAG: hypothetical protein AN488_00750 [Anabaena sp. WA113]OBQ39211.1 MAG: hypothetical protein AN484_23520 [Aphanizomenon flos-aquae WA102]QSV66931.1 MAG: hypothetical protein HEQ12_08210 [Aphanizomenon flos-aquae DEX188]
MDIAILRGKLERWSFPLGPFLSIEDVYIEMEEETHRLGSISANQLVEALIKLETEGDPLWETLDEFIVTWYSRNYPADLTEAVLQNLRPTGPPSIVGLLGCTISSNKAVNKLKQTLDLNNANDDLLEAFVGTIGDIGSAEDLEILHSLQKRQNLAITIKESIKIAISNIYDRVGI